METKSLQMFQHLARSLHFGKTAQAYFVSPSTLSRTMQRLEQQVGCQLLLRDNRSVALTSAGVKLLAYVDQQLEQWHLLKLALNASQASLTGKLHLYCSVTAAYSHLPPILDSFRQQHPLVEILLSTGDSSNAPVLVQQNEVDIAIAALPSKLADRLFFQGIADVPMVIIAPTVACKVNQLLQQSPIDWSALPFILPEHGPARERFESWFSQQYQGNANIYATVAGHEALVSMVALGCGAAIAPQVVVDNSPVKDRLQYLKSINDIAPLSLGLCCLQKRVATPLVAAFLAAAQAEQLSGNRIG
jgi:LysR family transcriptional regulator, positive regulator for ilvC